MRISHSLVGLILVFGTVLASRQMQPWKQLQRFENRRKNDAWNRDAAPEPVRVRSDYGSRFLTPKTKGFVVDTKQLPDIDFDLGESYAGNLPIGQSNDTLFFWFFPSTNPRATNEIVIWFTGGPGCSSMAGLFKENGPMTWMDGTYKPVLNPWSWHHLSNVVWIDQPVGTGYSTGTPTARSEEDLAKQFRGFWKNFVDTFDIQGFSTFITGESYAGLYCPYISQELLQQNYTEYYNVSGMMIFDGAYADDVISAQAPLVAFLDSWRGLFPLNDSYRADLYDRHAKCGYTDYLSKYLVFPPKAQQPVKLPGYNRNHSDYLPGCDLRSEVFEAVSLLNPCFNVYQVATQCPIPYDPLGFPAGNVYAPDGAPTVYFNRIQVKKALHAPPNADWAICKDYTLLEDTSLSSHIEAIPYVLERTKNVIIGHGSLDILLQAQGTLLAIQNMTWGGKLGFQKKPQEPLYVPLHPFTSQATQAGQGVFGTAHTERGLTFAAVALSGHMVPGNQPSVSYRMLEQLLGRIDSLQSLKPFSTDGNQTRQPVTDVRQLGNGTGLQMSCGPCS